MGGSLEGADSFFSFASNPPRRRVPGAAMSLRVGAVGPTGVLGQELMAALAEAARDGRLDIEPPTLLATAKSAGEAFPWLEEDEDVPVEAFSEESARGLDVALLAVPAQAATELTRQLRQQGTVVVDASSAHRDAAPLFADGPVEALAGGTLVALAAPETLMLTRLLAALSPLGPQWVRVSVLRSASAAGQAGVTELAESTGKLLNGQEPEAPLLGHRLAFNWVPQSGAFSGDVTATESAVERELPRATKLANLKVAATVSHAPWFYGTAAFVTVGLSETAEVARVRALLGESAGLKLLDTPAEAVYPMPLLATGDDAVLVGRIRKDPIDARALELVLAADAVRLSAVQLVAAVEAIARARAAH